jgi:hypothetical protein
MNARLAFRSCAGLCLAILVLASPSVVSAATTLSLSPDQARPGTKVTIGNACVGITDTPPDELVAAFENIEAHTPPGSPSTATAVATAGSAPRAYVVVVPVLQPGTYDIRLECLPGDWRTNTAEGGYQLLTILPSLPSTSTTDTLATGGQESPPVPVLVALGLAGAAIGQGRFARRASIVRQSSGGH